MVLNRAGASVTAQIEHDDTGTQEQLWSLLSYREDKPQAASSAGDAAEGGAADGGAPTEAGTVADKPVEETLQEAEEALAELSTTDAN